MATYSKVLLSESVNGKAISAVATATPGTLVHTAQSGTTGLDEVWIYATNSSSATERLVVEFGGNTSAENIELDIPGESGLLLVVPGLCLNNSLEVRAFSVNGTDIHISGYVNRITA